MGVEERVPGDKETWRSTPLGRELYSHLLMVFLGLWDEWEVPMILQDYGVIDDVAKRPVPLHSTRGIECNSINSDGALRCCLKHTSLFPPAQRQRASNI
jgi:hypothetical protein